MKTEMVRLNRIKYAYSDEDMERLLKEGYVPADIRTVIDMAFSGADDGQQSSASSQVLHGTDDGSRSAAPSQVLDVDRKSVV